MGDSSTLVGNRISAQNPQKSAKRSMAGIGATMIRKRPAASVKMPRKPGAIMTRKARSAASCLLAHCW